MSKERLQFGKAGEAAAVAHLKKRGYRIVKKNFRTAVGEIDIIAEHKKTVVFVEVKSRSSAEFGHPSEAVSPAKQRKLAQTAESFLARYPLKDRDMRFDVVSVSGNPSDPASLKVEIIEDAFRL